MHLAIFKLPKIYFSIGPKILAFSLLDPIGKTSYVLTSVRINLKCFIGMRFSVKPKTRILKTIVEKKSAKSIFLRVAKRASIKGAIGINENIILSLGLSLLKPALKIAAIREIDSAFSMGKTIEPLANVVYFFVKNKKTGEFISS